MCGINGFIQFKKQLTPPEMEAMLHRMNEEIIHRGPDQEGFYSDERCAMGMRRLSVIDLASGNQPVWNERHDALIIFNGEIYNYRVLRKRLITYGYHFTTESDTEVILAGYDLLGVEFIKQLEGMFAFAIYDKKRKEWTLCRDRAGEKPLYYYFGEGFCLFASEMKSLFSTALIPKEIDYAALSQYFQLTYIPAPKTILQNVYKLMPAHRMTIHENGRYEISPYWELDLDTDDASYQDYEICKKRLVEALTSSVERRMISDVPIGAFLSGGIDSTIIVGLMSRLSSTPINTFTIGFDDRAYDESGLAEIVAKQNRTNHHNLILDWSEVLRELDDLISNIDEPFADSSLIATYAVSVLARKHVTVALTGDSGDELFAGYNKYLMSYYAERYKFVPQFLRKSVIERAVDLLPSKSYTTQRIRKGISAFNLDDISRCKYLMSLGFKRTEIEKLLPDFSPDELRFVEDEYNIFTSADKIVRAQYVDFCTVLEGDMLPKVDRASMRASLETRVPMLDRDVVELAFRIPLQYKIRGKNRKLILKDAFSDLIPNELLHAPKHGFGVPISDWLERELKDNLIRVSDPEFLEYQGLFSPEYIQFIIGEHMQHKKDRFSELWAFYVFQLWYENYFV